MSFLVLDRWDVRVRLCEPLLGTVPKVDVYTQHIQRKQREALEKMERDSVPLASGQAVTPARTEAVLTEEANSVPPSLEKTGWTTFHKDDLGCFLYDYHIKGLLQEAARVLGQWPPRGGEAEEEEAEEEKPKKKGAGQPIKMLADRVKKHVFLWPRRIRLPGDPEGLRYLERPLRAQTMQGPRVTVVRSDMIPAETELEFTVRVLRGGFGRFRVADIVSGLLEYGGLQGLGQWRSGGYGRIEVIKFEPVPA